MAALNDNQPSQAKDLFTQAYRLDKQNAFTLNNLGYIAELEGDQESAEFYYQAVSSSADLNSKVSYSTRQDAEGSKIRDLANANQTDVDATLKTMAAARRRSQKPVELQFSATSNSTESTSGITEESTPVPPVGIGSPSLPALPPPSPEPQSSAPRSPTRKARVVLEGLDPGGPQPRLSRFIFILPPGILFRLLAPRPSERCRQPSRRRPAAVWKHFAHAAERRVCTRTIPGMLIATAAS